jgi:sigma-E factor negative regulatory protein RseB
VKNITMFVDMKKQFLSCLSVLMVTLFAIGVVPNVASQPHTQDSLAEPDTRYSFPAEKSQWKAIDWLMYMQSASVERNYQGRFMFTRGQMSSAMSITHHYGSGIERERLKQLDGEMGEIVRNGERVMCVFPDNRVVEVESSPVSHNFSNKFVGFMPGKSHYTLSIAGKERMIERSCVVVNIGATDSDRYGYRLWIDEEKGLLLKSELLDLEGEALERFQYTQINYPENIAAEVFEVMGAGKAVKHEMISTQDKSFAWSKDVMWALDWLPLGYEKINGQSREGQNVMVYSDGLATFSVFIESVEKGAMPEGASQVGATIAYSVERSIEGHDYHVTVVGEIPAMTAMKVAKSVKGKM